MTNSFYNHSTYPAPNAPGSSAALRSELDLVTAGFDKLPTLAGNGSKLVNVNAAGTALEASGSISNVDFTTTGIADAVARLTWNDTDGTLNLGLKGGNVVLQLGQEEVLRALNTTGSTITDGQAVYIVGASGQRPTIALAQANAEATSTKVIGIATETIANNQQGFIATAGLVRGMDTSAFAEGVVLWLSAATPGALTSTRPSAPSHGVMIGYCVKSHAVNGIIYVMVQNGYELDELHDVLISGLATNNMLRYNGTVWQNIAGPAGAVVGTTDTQTLTNKTISGGTVTGAAVTALPAPSGSTDAATKGYVDTQDALKLNLSGGTMSGAIAMGNNKITGLGTPTADADAATKAYVDGVAQGLDVKGSVVAATTANITLSGTQTIDGVAVTTGQRVLVKDQTAQAENGIYLVAAGSWTRTTDMDAWTEFPGAFVFVEQGTVNDNSGWVCTVSSGGTLGSTAVTFEQFSGAGQITAGAGMTKSGNTLNVGTASSARIVVNADNLDLATTGVTAGTYRSVTTDVYGRITGGTNPTTVSGYGITDAYTKTEVDTAVGTKVSKAGDTMSGDLAMSGFKVTGLGAPTTDNDAVRLKYVTDLYGSTASAANSAADALTYKNAAESAANTATTQASIATNQAGVATTQAGIATAQASNALASANAAAASFDSFDDRYLGAKPTPPILDNDGNALIPGALYFDSSSQEMNVYSGSAWIKAYLPSSSYLALSGGTMTGNIGFAAGQTFPGTLVTSDIGVTVQGYDADLAAIGAISATSGLLKKTAANTWSLDTSTYLTSSDIGSTVQAYDADLTSIAGLAGTSGFLKKTAANTWSLDTSTYLTSYTETDPVYSASPAAGITSTKITNWDTAYGWGNHASAGYLTSAAIGTTVQAYDADLTTWAGKTAPTGTVVGTTDTQTLTNKTISGSSNTITNVSLSTGVTGTLPVGNGGTGATSLTANNVLLGNGTSAFQVVAPGTAGNVLTSNGTTWVSQAAGASLSGQTDSASPFETSLGYQAGNVNTGTDNTFIGYRAGLSNTTGSETTAVGSLALDANTTGTNTAVGFSALGSNTTGSSNTGIGRYALSQNVTGTSNVAVGDSALSSNTGSFNVAVGQNALGINTTGADNVAAGYQALDANTTGAYNVAVGSGALGACTTGQSNVAVGRRALSSSTTGFVSVAIGEDSLFSQTNANNTAVGYYSGRSVTGTQNTIIGRQAMRLATTSNECTAVGENALYNATADYNTAVGTGALYTNTSGNSNSAFGYYSGYAVTTGTQNTFLGRNAGYSGTNNLTTGSNNILIGYNAEASSATISNEITLGNSSIATLRCQVTTITSLSDARDKTDIKELEAGLDFVKKLKPVRFIWNMRDGGKVGVADTGFIAQDLKAVQENTGSKIPDLVFEASEDRLEAGYGKLLPVLVKAIQDLSAEVESLKAQLESKNA